MHIEPGLVDGAKVGLGIATASGAAAAALRYLAQGLREKGLLSLAARSLLATVAVFVFFEVMPHLRVGISEVHLILGSTLFLLLGTGPAAVGLAAGLLIQGIFFAPADLPQYAMNVTTLLVPLFGLHALSRRVIAPGTAYVNLRYRQALALSTSYQGGIVAWVAFWAVWGQGLGAANLASIGVFAAAYSTVVIVEPLADLAVLAAAKSLHRLNGSALVTPRLFSPA